MVKFVSLKAVHSETIMAKKFKRRFPMKKLTACMILSLLVAGLLTGCRMPATDPSTTTQKTPTTSSSTLRPQPTTTTPSGTTQPSGVQGRIGMNH